MVPEGPFGNPARGVTTWDLKAPRGWQQPEVRGRLREAANHSLVLGVVLLRQQAHVVAPASARTNTAPARSSSPCWASACTSQKVQTRNVPSAPSVDISSVRYLRTRPFSVNVSVMASTVATPDGRRQAGSRLGKMTYFQGVVADERRGKGSDRKDRYRRGLPGHHDPTSGIGGAVPAISALTLRLWLAVFGLVICTAFAIWSYLINAPIGFAVVLLALAAVAVIDIAVILRRKRRGEPG